jgi:hypothetical protein
MRGFVVSFDTRKHELTDSHDSFERRVGEWQRTFNPSCLEERRSGRCRFMLFSTDAAIPPTFNQKLAPLPGEMSLWVGPRVDFTSDALFRTSYSSEVTEFASAVHGAPAVLDTTVYISYREAAQELLVKTDLLNSTYVYWTRFQGRLLLSNSSLMLARLTGARLDWVAASEFLASGSIYANRSLYSNIATLKPSTVYAFKAGSTAPASREYWRLEELPFDTLSAKEACGRIVEELDKDFDALDSSGRTFILDLTGGYDSRTNVGFALRRLKRFETTCSGKPGNEDVVISSAIARHFGFKHTVIPPVAEEDSKQTERLANSALLTDLEYDIMEYSRIYDAQTRFETRVQPSIHGSGGGDIARNIILRREFCDEGPDGKLVVEPLIGQRFRNLIPPQVGLTGLPISDWVGHMRSRIAQHDAPHLPAFARLDIIYLRMRMQFWQGRIASSTNRFRASFSPWTNRRVMETMLITRWRDRQRQMLSRLFLQALHPELTRFVVARGEPGGPTAWAAFVSLPARLRYYRERVAARLPGAQVPTSRNVDRFRHFAGNCEDILGNFVRPDALSSVIAKDGLSVHPQVVGRLATLARVKECLATI